MPGKPPGVLVLGEGIVSYYDKNGSKSEPLPRSVVCSCCQVDPDGSRYLLGASPPAPVAPFSALLLRSCFDHNCVHISIHCSPPLLRSPPLLYR